MSRSTEGTVIATIGGVLIEDDTMHEQGKNGMSSRSDSGFVTNSDSAARRQRVNYDVPIPRPTTDLGFRGVRRKRAEYESRPRRSQCN